MRETAHVTGTFNTPIPCPSCGTFMQTDYDGNGLPVAGCTDPHCNQTYFGDAWLKQGGHWEEDTGGD